MQFPSPLLTAPSAISLYLTAPGVVLYVRTIESCVRFRSFLHVSSVNGCNRHWLWNVVPSQWICMKPEGRQGWQELCPSIIVFLRNVMGRRSVDECPYISVNSRVDPVDW